MICKYLFVVLFSGIAACANAQHYTFDDIHTNARQEAQKASKQSGSLLSVYAPSYSEGIRGKALDLTSDVPVRIPLRLGKDQHPSFDQNASFSIQVWVQTKPGAPQGTPS